MRRNILLITFFILSILLLSGISTAGSMESLLSEQGDNQYGGQESVDEFKSDPDIKISSDNFGGVLCFYKDAQGNRCVTNDIGSITIDSPVSNFDTLNLASANTPGEPPEKSDSEDDTDDEHDDLGPDEPVASIPDPLEPINRIFFHFNDKLYFWFLKPLSSGYRVVVPEPARIGVKNFFHNLAFPVRFVNCLLQGKFQSASDELGRFLVNSTFGLGGLFDIATSCDLKSYDEDLGQTFGSYGMGPSIYINWPIFGPSCLRDTFGMAGDSFLDPLNYMAPRTKYNITVKGYKTVNKTSFYIGDYEDIKKAALDPYVAIRDAYFQYRKSKIKD